MTQQRDYSAWGVTGVMLLALGLTTWMRHGWVTVVNLDSAIYGILANSLAHGQGYLLQSDPNPTPYFTFPPLLPWMLAGCQTLAMAVSPQLSPFALQGLYKLVIHLMWTGGVGLFALWLQTVADQGTKRYFPKRWLLWATLLAVALGPLFYKYSEDVLSDVPFWVWVMVALYAAEVRGALPVGAPDDATSPFVKVMWFVVGLVAVLAAALTRQMGLALVVAWLGVLVVKRCWKKAVVSLVAFVLVLGSWQATEHVYRSQQLAQAKVPVANTLNQAGVQQVLEKSPIKLEFIKHFLVVKPVSQDAAKQTVALRDRLQLAWQNLQQYGQIGVAQVLPRWPMTTSTGKHNVLGTPAVAGLLACFMAIGVWATRRVTPLTWAYSAVSMIVLLNYPYVSPRFLLPLMPFVLLALFLGLQQVARTLKPLGGKVAFGFTTSSAAKVMLALRWAMAWILCPGLVWLAVGTGAAQALRWVNHGHQIGQQGQGPSRDPANLSYYDALVWIKHHAPPGTLVVSRKPPVTFYYSGQPSVAFPFTQDDPQLMAFLQTTARQNQPRFTQVWVLEDAAFSESQSLLTPAMAKHPQQFAKLYQHPRLATRVWAYQQRQ